MSTSMVKTLVDQFLDMTPTRTCCNCFKSLPLDDFGYKNAEHTQRESRCRSCKSKAVIRSQNRAKAKREIVCVSKNC